MANPNSFNSLADLKVGDSTYSYYRLASVAASIPNVANLPVSLRILLENLLRYEDGRGVTKGDVEALASWKPNSGVDREISFTPARVLLQDFTGVPVVVDLASMRAAIRAMGGNPEKINPLQPVDLVIDHSVMVDEFGTSSAFADNMKIEFERNLERYTFLRWGQQAFRNFRAVPPGTGICHQVNLEYLASVAFRKTEGGKTTVYPDTVVGTDSHTTMINGLGVLGWGVGGIEAEAAMLGQPVAMLIPEVVGFKLTGKLPEGATGTDLVLTVTQMLRAKGVVGKFVEFFGTGLTDLPLATRATIANMAPEYGATMGFFPVDDETLRYLRFTGREEALVQLVEAYAKAQGIFRTDATPEPAFSDTLHLDMSQVVPSMAGPKRPQDRVPLTGMKADWEKNILADVGADKIKVTAHVKSGTDEFDLEHGSVVIAAITSCTNTSNPEVIVGAGLVAKHAVEKGITRKPWVKTSLAPGSQVVTEYLHAAGLDRYLDQVGFNLVGYGCTTCIGNSGPLSPEITEAIHKSDIAAAAVISGNRNFEGRVHPEVKANYLASPPLVVAYALAGRMDIDLATEPLGTGSDGKPVYLKDIWPTQAEVSETMQTSVRSEMFRSRYADVFKGDDRWANLKVPTGELYEWDEWSTYVKNPPYFDNMPKTPAPITDIAGARVLVAVADSVTTDHISPAGNIDPNSPAGRYLHDRDIARDDFNSYGARRGNHEVMMRGTFANIRLKNELAPGTEGSFTRFQPDNAEMTIFDASEKYKAAGTPLLILAGKEYGTGSSRDWAAKGPALLGVKAVMAESYERIHRSNLVGMGILPLQFQPGQDRKSLGLTGRESYAVTGIASGLQPKSTVTVTATDESGKVTKFETVCRIDTPVELDYYRHGGILQYVLRQLIAQG
ncbi:MAG TPA: aconitate hydratase AcnA [Tepidiformaceae bacterium]